MAATNRASGPAPDFSWFKEYKAWVHVAWQGQLDTLRAVVEHMPEDSGGATDKLSERVALALWERRPKVLLKLLPKPQRVIFEAQAEYEPAWLYVAWAHPLRGDSAAARSAFLGALRQLDSASRGRPDDWRLHASHGLALAGLGQRAEAKQEADWLGVSAESLGVFWAAARLESRAKILAQARLTDAAPAQIEPLLAGSSLNVSVPVLRIDPRWDPIRHDPRFQALLIKYAGR